MKRFGQVIGIKPEFFYLYKKMHAEPWPEVVAANRASNIRNYSIFRYGNLLFAYFEYMGDDFAADMAKMAANCADEISRTCARTLASSSR